MLSAAFSSTADAPQREMTVRLTVCNVASAKATPGSNIEPMTTNATKVHFICAVLVFGCHLGQMNRITVEIRLQTAAC